MRRKRAAGSPHEDVEHLVVRVSKIRQVVRAQGRLAGNIHAVELALERDRVLFMPLTWTIVHPIDSQSPLNGMTAAALAQMQAEVLILVKGVDDSFSQTVHARYSYRFDEIVWNARFAPAFDVDADGDLRLELNKVSKLAAG